MKIPEKPMDVFDEIRDDLAHGVIWAVAITLAVVSVSWLVMEYL